LPEVVLRATAPMISILVKCRLIFIVLFGTKTSIYKPIWGHLNTYLKRLGYRPDAVADGCEVLQVLKIRHYDLIIRDINMPEMDGITATKEIRRLWPAAEQPHIVAVTAFAMESDRETCLEAGMNDYIAKLVLKKDLETILMKCSGAPVCERVM